MASTIAELVDEFTEANVSHAGYKEDWVRTDFIEPLFGFLGWSRLKVASLTTKSTGFIRETTQQVAGSPKAPDYGFYVDGQVVMYVEAKKPFVNVATDKAHSFQLRRYSWNAHHPVGVLTNFETFAVYETTREPEPTDATSVARLELIQYNNYLSAWDWLEAYFTPDAIRNGSLARLISAAPNIKKTKPVDTAFLVDMESWRSLLAQDIHANNPKLSTRELNDAVQAIIDRLVFLRIAEARGLEDHDALANIGKEPKDLYASLRKLFQTADARYNSGLFHFKTELNRSKPDTLTPSLKVNDSTLRAVIRRLVPTESPYDFRVLPVEILGQAYERFLGNVIEIDSNNEVTIEPKPDVKKAHGIYYTPRFIVNYIVKRTLNQLLQGKSVTEAERVRIVDPACGSGSFLVAAYEYLLDWHLARYVGNQRYRNRISIDGVTGRPRLKTEERKRILLNSIFGVDLDSQAVEVAKLSLLLKVIEGETQLAFQVQRLLPDLDQNIRRGNALIGPDYFSVTNTPLTADASYEVSPFVWQEEFPAVFGVDPGGFDAVIGNPPYFSVDATWGKDDPRRRYLKATYEEVYNDKTDVLFYFLKRAIDISRGEVAFIVSRAFLEAYKGDKLRSWLASNAGVREIVDFRNAIVFPKVGITTAIVRLSKTSRRSRATFRQLVTRDLPVGVTSDRLGDELLFRSVEVPQASFGSAPWSFGEEGIERLIASLDAKGPRLDSILHVGQGMQTGANEIFGNLSGADIQGMGAEDVSVYRRVRNTQVRRWCIEESEEFILYLEDYEHFSDLPVGVQDYLLRKRSRLEARAAFLRGNCEWWKYTWPLHCEHFHAAKIFCPYLATENRFAIEDKQEYIGLTDTTVMYSGNQPEDLRYVVALLNSKLLTFRLWHSAKLKSNGIREYFDNNVGLLPIVRLDRKDSRYLELISLVDKATSDSMALLNSIVADHRKALKKQLETTEDEIDARIFELYGVDDSQAELVYEVLSRG